MEEPGSSSSSSSSGISCGGSDSDPPKNEVVLGTSSTNTATEEAFIKPEVAQDEDQYIKVLSQWDVLLGRGTGPNEHSGNKNFRKVVEARMEKYFSTTSRKEKSAVIRSAIQDVKMKTGRFLRKLELDEVVRLRGNTVEEEIVDATTATTPTPPSNDATKTDSAITTTTAVAIYTFADPASELEKTKQAFRYAYSKNLEVLSRQNKKLHDEESSSSSPSDDEATRNKKKPPIQKKNSGTKRDHGEPASSSKQKKARLGTPTDPDSAPASTLVAPRPHPKIAPNASALEFSHASQLAAAVPQALLPPPAACMSWPTHEQMVMMMMHNNPSSSSNSSPFLHTSHDLIRQRLALMDRAILSSSATTTLQGHANIDPASLNQHLLVSAWLQQQQQQQQATNIMNTRAILHQHQQQQQQQQQQHFLSSSLVLNDSPHDPARLMAAALAQVRATNGAYQYDEGGGGAGRTNPHNSLNNNHNKNNGYY